MSLLYSLVCVVICVHAVIDLNCATRHSSRLRRAVLLVMAGGAFAGVWRPAMDETEAAAVSTLLLAVLAVDCLIRHHWRHLYNDRADPALIARLLDRIG